MATKKQRRTSLLVENNRDIDAQETEVEFDDVYKVRTLHERETTSNARLRLLQEEHSLDEGNALAVIAQDPADFFFGGRHKPDVRGAHYWRSRRR